MTLKEIETKERALLVIKKIRKGLTGDEEILFSCLDDKYRTKKGRLKKGSYYINSCGNWATI